MKSSILLVDGHSIINRAFYGIGDAQRFTAKDGTPTGAVMGFFNIVNRYVSELEPTHLCVAFDRPEPTFRHLKYDGYKGTRKSMPDELHVQVPIVKELLDAMTVCRTELAGYEADDLLGTMAKRFQDQGFSVWILTGDRDSFQLADEQITIVMPQNRQSGGSAVLYTPDQVLEQYGVTPEQFVDLKAIMGDTSDNIPGVAGIGEKGACRLIQQYGSLAAVYEHLQELKPGEQKKLTASREQAFLSLDLAAIRTDAPIEVTAEMTLRRPVSETGAYGAFKRYDLNALIRKYHLTPGSDAGGADGISDASSDGRPGKSASSPAIEALLWPMETVGAEALLGRLLDSRSAAARPVPNATPDGATAPIAILDGFFASEPGAVQPFDQLGAVELAVGLEPGAGYRVTLASRAEAIRVFDALSAGFVLVGFDLKRWFRYFDCRPAHTPFDLMSGAYLLTELSGKAPVREQLLSDAGLDEADLQNPAAVLPAFHSLYLDQLAALEARGLRSLALETDMKLVPILGRMEAAGFAVDRSVLDGLSAEFGAMVQTLEQSVYELTGQIFNINSPKQLGKVLYEDLGLPTGRKSATRQYSTNIEEMERLRPLHPVIDAIIRYRQISKLRSTFVDGLSAYIGPDGRIHAHFNQNLTATGRLSSSDPNLQNIPIRQAEGREIRRAFVARPGYVLIDADYSQIELRLLAHLSGDERMIGAFADDLDIHRMTAATLFSVPIESVTDDMRRAAKTVNFSIVYGVSDFGLAQDLSVSIQAARDYIEGYDRQFPMVRRYMTGLIEQARVNGYVETLFGRRRYIPELKAKNRNMRSFGERAAMNAPVQGTAADVMRMAMVRVSEGLEQAGLESRIISQVHDELLVEAPAAEAERAAAILKQGMESAVSLSVPLAVSLSIAGNWFDAK